MDISSPLRTAMFAVSLFAAMGSISAAFADSSNAAANQQQLQQQQQQQQQTSNTGPYDSPDFVVPSTNVYP
jgi:hypothetical protein